MRIFSRKRVAAPAAADGADRGERLADRLRWGAAMTARQPLSTPVAAEVVAAAPAPAPAAASEPQGTAVRIGARPQMGNRPSLRELFESTSASTFVKDSDSEQD